MKNTVCSRPLPLGSRPPCQQAARQHDCRHAKSAAGGVHARKDDTFGALRCAAHNDVNPSIHTFSSQLVLMQPPLKQTNPFPAPENTGLFESHGRQNWPEAPAARVKSLHTNHGGRICSEETTGAYAPFTLACPELARTFMEPCVRTAAYSLIFLTTD